MKNGDRYEGDTKNGYREGKGILWFNSGAKYEGDFIKSKFEVKKHIIGKIVIEKWKLFKLKTK